jgi:hypothetical protein
MNLISAFTSLRLAKVSTQNVIKEPDEYNKEHQIL